ncbi:MAG TPA: hypothetical protein VK498_15750 [Ferruginibacter sp.]|nr:hypothetical protein [Ferruginibacter sp.]
MEAKHLKKAAILALILVIGFTAFWEFYWRSNGFPVSYEDGSPLWSSKRGQVYKPIDKSTVFIGSSRIKFDLDIPTWEKLSGEEAVQLAFVGTNPQPLLQNLANDEKFKGKLIIDVTEGLFFSQRPQNLKRALDGIEYYNKWTPSQRMGELINYQVESRLVSMEESRFGLNDLLEDLELPNRKGVFSAPRFPKEFGLTHANRQDYMLPAFLKDTSLQNRQTMIWTGFYATDTTFKGIGGDTLLAVFKQVKSNIDKIKSRGGRVIFVRTPASGPFEAATKITHPRSKYWDPMLAYTNTEGIHYSDYPATDHFICPEWSHLSPSDAITYTTELVKTLKEKGWFSGSHLASNFKNK